MRLWTSLNWVFAVLALIVAFAGPAVLSAMEKPATEAVEEHVDQIVAAQGVYRSDNNIYFEFDATDADNQAAVSALGLGDLAASGFLYLAQADSEGGLTVVARTHPNQLFADGGVPSVYTKRVDRAGQGIGEGVWKSYAHGKRGLGLF